MALKWATRLLTALWLVVVLLGISQAATGNMVGLLRPFIQSPDGSVGNWMTTFPYGPSSSTAARTLAGNHEAECYSDPSVGVDPFAMGHGYLNIQAAPATAPNVCGLPYTSGLITTYKSFAQLYGTFEIKAKLPKGKGLWSAWWFLPASGIYTSELDAFEVLGDSPTTLNFTTHGADASGTWGSDFQPLTVPDTSDGFHVYTIRWAPQTITLSMDGHVIATAPTPASMNTPMYMLLNLAVGGEGSWPGAPDGTTVFPANMQVAYVHAWPYQP